MPSKTPAGAVLPGHKHRGLVVILVVWVCLAIVAPVTAEAGAPAGSAVLGAAGRPQVSWAACGPRLECADVPVPLDWRRPNGPRISLSVVRHLASRPERRIGSLFVNPGGPGDSGVGYVAERGEALDAMTGGHFGAPAGPHLQRRHRPGPGPSAPAGG